MTFLKRFLSSLALSSIAFVMAFTEVAGAADPIKIGMTVSSQGRFALAAQSGERGLKIWINDVNSRGGISINGQKRKIELLPQRFLV